MKRKVTLDEAIKSMSTPDYSIKYDEENDKFIIPLFKSSNPRIDVKINTDFTIGLDDKIISDFDFSDLPEYTGTMNMNFNGHAKVLFGKYEVDNDKHIFSVTDPREAEQVLVRVGLKHDFHEGRIEGQSVHSPEAESALYFEKIKGSDQLEEDGLDYYILNVGQVLKRPERAATPFLNMMSSILANMEKYYEHVQEKREEIFTKLIHEYEENIDTNNEKIKELKSLVMNSSLPKDSGLCKKILDMKPLEKTVNPYDLFYDNLNIKKLDHYTEVIKDALENLPEYKEKMEQYKNTLDKYGVIIKEDPSDDYIAGTHFQADLGCFNMPTFHFSLTKNEIKNLEGMANHASRFGSILLRDTTEKKQKEQKQLEKLKELDKRGKEIGCPSNYSYTFYASSDFSHCQIADIAVVNSYGKRRKPDIMDMGDFSYDKSKYMCWNQIHENEAVITLEYDSDLDRAIQFHPEWMPPILSRTQLDRITSFVEESSKRYHLPIETEEGKIATREEIIKVCKEKYNEQEKEVDEAYKDFKEMEEKLEYTLTDEYARQIAENPESTINIENIAKNYVKLADTYGFETKLEISGFEEDKMIIYEKSNDTYDR